MGIEAAVEQGIKTAFKVYTDTLDPANAVTYRCFFLDDEDESGADTEERKLPLIQITAAPNVPTGHKSVFRDIPVAITFATHKNVDRKRATLRALYEACRAIVDADTTIAVTGYSYISTIIESGGDSDVEDNEQRITLPLMVKICGA